MIISKLTSRLSLSLLLCSTYLQYLGSTYFIEYALLTYFFMISRMKYTKNVLIGSPAVLVRDEIHCNKYPGTRRVMRVGYPGSKISTHFNPGRFLIFLHVFYLAKVYLSKKDHEIKSVNTELNIKFCTCIINIQKHLCS